MGWKAQFINRLKRGSITPVYRLKFLYIGAFGPPAGDVYISSVDSTVAGKPRILEGSVKVQGTSVIPQSWNVSFGGFQLAITGDIRTFIQYLSRGSFAELQVDIGTGYETIGIGALKTIRAEKPIYYLQFADLISSLQASTDTNTVVAGSILPRQKNIVMAGLGIESTLSANYNQGDTELYVNNIDLFVQETGKEGHVRIIDGSDDFVIGYNGKTSTHLTNVSAGFRYPSLQSIPFSTIHASTAIVKPLAVLPGFPGEILGKILMSTGTGGNGSLDVYPAEFSVRATFGSFAFDQQDVDFIKQRVITLANQDPTYEYNVAIESEFTGGLRDFVTIAAKTGQWPVFRQNSISWRGCVDPYGDTTHNNVVNPTAINDRNIHRISSHDLYNPQNPNIYTRSSMDYYQGTGMSGAGNVGVFVIAGNRAQSLPYVDKINRVNTFTYSGSPYSTAGQTIRENHARADMGRMLGYDSYTHEKVVLDVDIQFSRLVAGDIVSLTSNYLYGLSEGPGQTYNNRLGMIIGSSFDFTMQRTQLTIAILPTQQYRRK